MSNKPNPTPKPEDKALEVIQSFESGDLINPGMEIIPGIEQLTTPIIKFEKDNQVLMGLYLGAKECVSSMPGPSDYFYFHTVRMPNGLDVGFCGSKALDDALRKKRPGRFVIYIKYVKEKKVAKGNFKEFQIMGVDMENKDNPLYKIPNHPMVKIFNDYKDNITPDQGGEVF